jgi:hypothetical protein
MIAKESDGSSHIEFLEVDMSTASYQVIYCSFPSATTGDTQWSPFLWISKENEYMITSTENMKHISYIGGAVIIHVSAGFSGQQVADPAHVPSRLRHFIAGFN